MRSRSCLRMATSWAADKSTWERGGEREVRREDNDEIGWKMLAYVFPSLEEGESIWGRRVSVVRLRCDLALPLFSERGTCRATS